MSIEDRVYLVCFLRSSATFKVNLPRQEAIREADAWTKWKWGLNPIGEERIREIDSEGIKQHTGWKANMLGGIGWGVDLHQVDAMIIQEIEQPSPLGERQVKIMERMYKLLSKEFGRGW